MEFLGIIVIGFFVGLVARFVKPGNDSKGFIATTIIGIVGAFLGSYLGEVLGIYRFGEPVGFIGAVVGSVIVLAILKAMAKRPTYTLP
jgi:uncharacterized membrane protein YeaQ/YmgE (transglycosylase-associated protein family)